MTKLQAFYKSKRWEQFVERLRLERAGNDGAVICEHCGKPIVRKYDCIGHHKEELTEYILTQTSMKLRKQYADCSTLKLSIVL